ncbi:MAG: Vir protein [Tatlockia sp.]|nr:Vir protein [Tatlockia sp.]
MEDIKQYNRAREAIEHSFQGLPYTSSKLIQLLITRADPATGIVEDLSSRDLAILMAVDHAPGRKGAGIPKIETIRSYLRTIQKSCPNDFKLISVGQKLKVQFINMPQIYAYFCVPKEVYGVMERALITEKEDKSLISPDLSSESDLYFEEVDITKVSAGMNGKTPVKNIYITNKLNKLTPQGDESAARKQPISPDFKPSQDSIALALSRGFTQAQDPEEIQKFISYNLENNYQWEDFNPVFLMWLERANDYLHHKQQQKQHYTQFARSRNNERSSPKDNSYEAALETVRKHNPNPISPDALFPVRGETYNHEGRGSSY